MKDSQPVVIPEVSTDKYIKESNERFSTCCSHKMNPR